MGILSLSWKKVRMEQLPLKVIEQFNENRIQQLLKLYKDAWWALTRHYDDVVKMLAETSLTLGLVEIEKDELIGFTRVLTDGVYKAVIFDVVIRSDYQGKGLGKQLMNTVLEHERIQPVEHVELYCGTDKLRFYEQLGFEDQTNIFHYMRLRK